MIWIAWALALAVLAVKVRRSLPEIRAVLRRRGGFVALSLTLSLTLSPLRGARNRI